MGTAYPCCRLAIETSFFLCLFYTAFYIPPCLSVIVFFILAFPMHECLGNTNAYSTFPIAMLNGTCCCCSVKMAIRSVSLVLDK